MVSFLIIEDDRILRNLYEMMLTLNGYKICLSTDDGEAALELYKSGRNRPDIILLDHRMPIKTGLDIAQEIFEFDMTSKIIFLSADANVRDKALSIGVKAFLQKPFRYEELLQEIEKIIIKQDSITDISHY